jgi:hypothetical protein
MTITDDYSFGTLSTFLDIVDDETANEIESTIVNSESV